jgi:hypothetical protein
MQRFKLLLLISTLFITFTACNKEESLEIPNNAPGNNNGGNNGGNSEGSELGTWNFVSLQASTKETVEAAPEKLITVSEYTTINNKGTVKFENSKMIVNNVSYSVNSTATGYYYIDGVLEDSITAPFAGTIPAVNSTADYKKIGTDSIYVTASPLSVPESGGNAGGTDTGYKLSWDGKRMFMTIKYAGIRPKDVNGIILNAKVELTGVITLEKP